METSGSLNNKINTWPGFWSGLIWLIVGYICIIVSQFSAIIALAVLEVIQTGAEINEERIKALTHNGDALALAFLVLLPMIIAILAFVVKIRRKQCFFAYLGIRPVEKRVLAIWLLYAVIFFITAYVCDRIFNRPIIPEWMVTTYSTVDHPWLFFFSIAVLGPLSEELLYRGYVIKVWAESIIGPIVGSILLSLAWAAIHFQYDLYDMTFIFFMGMVLCISRLRTNSIIPALIIHMGWNTVGLVMLVLYRVA